MSAVINTNITSLNSQRNLATSQSALTTAIQRLSSGLRINSAKDDAAGLAISTRMASQINGLDQAARNANDGISLAQTAEGGLSTATDILQRMRTLAVQAANGTNSASDRASIQSEVGQLQQEMNRVSNNTQFNGQNLLDGSLNNAQFQVGANANQTINFSISSASASALGNNKVSAAGSTMTVATAAVSTGIPANGAVAQTLTIQGNGATKTAGVLIGASAYTVAASINAASGSTGVTATAITTATLGGFASAGGSYSLTLQGAPTAGGAVNPVTITATLANDKDVNGLTAAINAQSGVTGITAVADTNTGKIALTQAQGYDIGVTNGSAAAQTATLLGSGASPISLTGGGTNSSTVGGTLTFNSASSFTIAGTGTTVLAAAANSSTLSSVANIDLTTLTNGVPSGANDALQVIDSALANINSSRAALGAVQNRFTTTISNLQSTSENLSSAKSRILDTDFAVETAAMTRGQILQQAGTAMLSQANQLPNTVLSLLK